jgi:Ca2+-binding RTX toxin-like protein
MKNSQSIPLPNSSHLTSLHRILTQGALLILLVLGAASASAQTPPIYLELAAMTLQGVPSEETGTVLAIEDGQVALGAPARTVAGVSDAGAVEITDLDSSTPITITNPQPETDARFGAALAIHKGFIAIGAPGASSTGPGSGVVYLFNLAGQQMGSPISSPGTSEAFGTSLLFSGNGDLLISSAGAPGTIHRFDLSGFETAPSVTNPDPASFPLFGTAFVLSVDNELLVTALDPDSYSGALYRFDRHATLLSSTYFTGTDLIALATIGNGDVLVGVPSAGDSLTPALSAPDAGLALRLDRAGNVVTVYQAPNGAGARFGAAIVELGAVVVVAAPRPLAGKVYFYDPNSGQMQRTLSPSGGTASSGFGCVMATHQDALVVSAPADEPGTVAEPQVFTLRPAEIVCDRPVSEFDTVQVGTDDNESMEGTAGDDLIVLFGGNDSARGRGGDDCILGGDGSDDLFGGAGVDYLDGGNGEQDHCSGGEVTIGCEY